MKYENICKGYFIDRPNRFIAHVEIEGEVHTVHVKNTGRCAELLKPGTEVYLQDSKNPARKTRYDLIGAKKGERQVNMDSQVTNTVVKEWIEEGNLFDDATSVKSEYTYGNSRFDLYVEAGNRRALIEVKGVTLEEQGVVRFPDAPSERAVKHMEELMQAVQEGYEAYVFFVVQMKDVLYFTPNMDTHAAFGEALIQASKKGVNVLAYDCDVTPDSIKIRKEVPVVLENPSLYAMRDSLVNWYRMKKRDLPWRENNDPYRIWVSEIMLQQTRVEAVKPYFARFLNELPTVKHLAEAPEDKILKLWEGLGYYNRVRNMQKAAQQIMIDHNGEFPKTYEEIKTLKGIGNYTAGAISSFAYGIPKPAVDGNVLRVITRILADESDIMKQSTKTRIEEALEKVIPGEAASDFNQGLIELGAIVCVPNGEPKCEECPVAAWCKARKEGLTDKIPVKAKAKERRIEKKTILIFRDGEKIAISKRGKKGLLAGLYELQNEPGHMTIEEVTRFSKEIGLMPIHIKELPEAKHIFSHVEWHMIGYEIRVDELEKINKKGLLFIHPEEIKKDYPIPSAFDKYNPCKCI